MEDIIKDEKFHCPICKKTHKTTIYKYIYRRKRYVKSCPECGYSRKIGKEIPSEKFYGDILGDF